GFTIPGGECVFELTRKPEVALFFRAAISTLAVDVVDRHQHADGIRHQRLVALGNEAIHVQERRDRACRVCASAEPEQEYAVSILEIVHQEYVRIADIGFEPVTKRLAEKARERARASRERAGRLHGAEARMIIGDLSSR